MADVRPQRSRIHLYDLQPRASFCAKLGLCQVFLNLRAIMCQKIREIIRESKKVLYSISLQAIIFETNKISIVFMHNLLTFKLDNLRAQR